MKKLLKKIQSVFLQIIKPIWTFIKKQSSTSWTNIIFVGILIACVVLGIWIYEHWDDDNINPFLSFIKENCTNGTRTEKIEFYKFLGLCIGSWLLLWQAILTGIRTGHGNKNIEIQLHNAIDERFNNAITLIGNARAATRLGAIYALDHIARDTYQKEKSYTKTVFQILCSFIRETTNAKTYKTQYKEKPSVEIQTIIDLLFKAHENTFHGYAALEADLSYSYLHGADFSQAHCEGADFHFAHCEDADFTFAHCGGAKFWEAHCEGADFWEAHCEGADFSQAHCEGAKFNSAHCKGAKFNSAHCKGADFWGAHCEGAIFWAAHCGGADFTSAHCEGADFWGAENVNLQNIIGTPKSILKEDT